MENNLTTNKQPSTITSPQELSSHLLNFLNRKDIDWEGNCKFDENGKVIEFLISSPGNHYGMKPIPKSDELVKDAGDADKLLASIMRPASKDAIILTLKKLSLHCGMQTKAPEEVQFLLIDYCNDLSQYPRQLIEEACAEYRQLPEGNDFLPSSGKLISLMSNKYNKMKFLRTRIDKILGKYEPVPERGNKSISLSDAINNLEL